MVASGGANMNLEGTRKGEEINGEGRREKEMKEEERKGDGRRGEKRK